MRILSLISALAVLATAVAGVSIPRDGCSDSEMGCNPPSAPAKRDFIDHPSRNVRGMTNAQLLRRGLPLNGPALRRGTPVRRTSPSSAPPVKITHTGIIGVLDPSNNILGYVSEDLGNGGTQYVYDPSLANALVVTFQTDRSGSGTKLDITAVNSNPSWPLLGLIQGRDDSDSTIQPGSFQYLYLGGVANPGTKPGDTPQSISNSYFVGAARTAETAVWSYDSGTGLLTPEWINPDGSSPAEDFFTQATGLYVGGDIDAFYSRYSAPITAITFKFIPQ